MGRNGTLVPAPLAGRAGAIVAQLAQHLRIPQLQPGRGRVSVPALAFNGDTCPDFVRK